MSTRVNLSEAQRRQARRNATISALYGCIAELMLDSSAVVITYLMLLGGDSTFSLLSTSVGSIAYMLLLIPMARINNFLGLKLSVRIACTIGMLSFLSMALAPSLFGDYAKYVVLAGAFGYGLTKPLYLTAWYPLLDGFLRPAERGSFFGTMRFLYMLLNAFLIMGIGLIIGREPPIWLMQIILGLAGLTIMGRDYYIQKLPEEKRPPQRYELLKSLRAAIKNGPLTGFSLYICFVSLGNALLVPLGYIYLKSHLEVGHNSVVIISGLTMLGSIVGYLISSRVLQILGTKWVLIACHCSFILLAFGCFACGKETPYAAQLITILLMLHGLINACFSVCNSSELMALSRPGNKIMTSAFYNTCVQTGISVSRGGCSLILGSGMLAASWPLGTREISSFQTLFLLAGLALVLGLLMLMLIPAVVPNREDYYESR